jgi:hypothetical protein
MKYKIAILIILISNALIGQIPEKQEIQNGYSVGHKVFEAIQILDKDLIKDYYKDTTNLSFLLNRVETNKLNEDSIKIEKEVMYNQETKNYEFLVYGGKYIPTEDDWGLYKYLFVLQIEIDLRKEGRKNQILKTSIIADKDKGQLKNWWRSYMKSYNDPKYAKKEIAGKYNLVPPPPPPPETKEWF